MTRDGEFAAPNGEARAVWPLIQMACSDPASSGSRASP